MYYSKNCFFFSSQQNCQNLYFFKTNCYFLFHLDYFIYLFKTYDKKIIQGQIISSFLELLVYTLNYNTMLQKVKKLIQPFVHNILSLTYCFVFKCLLKIVLFYGCYQVIRFIKKKLQKIVDLIILSAKLSSAVKIQLYFYNKKRNELNNI